MHVLFHLDSEEQVSPDPSTEDASISDEEGLELQEHDVAPPGVSQADSFPISNEISEEALKAAIDFVQICCQHAVYIAGHGKIEEELDLLGSGKG